MKSVSATVTPPRMPLFSPTQSHAKLLLKRHRKARLMEWMGLASILCSLGCLLCMLGAILWYALPAFWVTSIGIPIDLSSPALHIRMVTEDNQVYPSLEGTDIDRLIVEGLLRAMNLSPDVLEEDAASSGVADIPPSMALRRVISHGASFELQSFLRTHPHTIGHTVTVWFTASSATNLLYRHWRHHPVPASPEDKAPSSHWQDWLQRDHILPESWLQHLNHQELLAYRRSPWFLTTGDSQESTLAGIRAGMVGSLYVLLVCFALAIPFGVCTAIYLEEFAPQTRLLAWIEVNINNLAAVPSIIFGLLGFTVYLGMMHLPRASSLVGGMTLAMMVLPTVVVTTRQALRSVPRSLIEGVIALGATPLQTLWHHTLPMAVPGIVTGSMLSFARVMGETAPLVMIGMVAFIVDVPQGLLDPTAALPVQIYLWAEQPDQGFAEKTAAAIMLLLAFLIVISAGAVYIRRRCRLSHAAL